MQAKHPAVIVAVVIVLVAVAAQFVVPLLNSDQAKVEHFAAQHVEKARRLLQDYQYSYSTLAASRAKIDAAGIELPAPKAQVAKAFNRNDSLLTDAAKLLNEAVNYQAGSARGSDLVEPNYLLGMVLYYQAVNDQLASQTQRARARQARWQTLKLITSAQSARTDAKVAALGDLTPVTQKVAGEIAQVQAKADDARSQAESLQRRVEQLQAKIAPLRQKAEQARRSLAVLKLNAPSPDDLAASAEYRHRWAELAKTERQAEYEADALEHGWLAGATLDPNAPADALLTAYVGGRLEEGLVTLQQRLATSRARAEGYAQAVADLRQQLDQLQQREAVRVERAERARTMAAARVAEVKESLDGASRLAAEAETTESKALGKLDQSRRSLNTALRTAGKQAQAARPPVGKSNERLEMISSDRSWDAELNSLLAETFVRQAEIDLQRVNDLAGQESVLQEAVLLVGGRRAPTSTPASTQQPSSEPVTEPSTEPEEGGEATSAPAPALAGSPARPTELDDALRAVRVKQAESRDDGVASIDRPDSEDDAIGYLTKAKRAESSKTAWVIDAQMGTTWYLLAQLTDDPQMRRQAVDNAVAVLEEALKTSGGQPRGGPYAEPFSGLLSYLQLHRTP